MKLFLRTLLTATLLLLAACAKKHSHEASGGHGKHEHRAPHGGTAVVLGDEQYHIEFVRDASKGTLTAYVLDGHMEKFIRSDQPSFALDAVVGGEKQNLDFRALANPATGETVGDTSSFEASADWLKTTPSFEAVIKSVTIRGKTFSNVAFNFPKGNEP